MQPSDYIGKRMLIRRPMLPASAQFIDINGYLVTGIRSKRQLLLQPLHESCKARAWTRMGDHIAITCDSEEQYQRARDGLLVIQEKINALNLEGAEFLKSIAN